VELTVSMGPTTLRAALDPAAFGSRLKLTFTGYHRTEALTDFPLLVNLSTNLTGFSYSQFASPSGGDLRFSDSSGTNALLHEIDEWNTNGTSRVWVRVPQLAGPADFIWAYWGNGAATAPPAWATNGTVWSADSYAVYHLKEGGFPYADSTLQHPAQPGVAPVSASGFIGKGCTFDGSSQHLDAGAFDLGDAFTLSAWINLSTSLSGNGMVAIWANKPGGWNANGIGLFVNFWGSTDRSVRLETGDGTNGLTAYSAANAISFGEWHWLTAVVNRSAGSARLYVDGADCTQSGDAWTTFATTNDLNLGRVLSSSTYFKGTLDEARIESTLRSADWVWASWMTVASNTTLTSYSTVARQIPVLSLTDSASGLTLAWPTHGVDFSPYRTTNLAPPVCWIPLTNQSALVNTQWQMALRPDTSAVEFYRLQSR
jgi:trimeric autotransporter adhesin